jgi:NADH-quinone oxidoreductase subunit J
MLGIASTFSWLTVSPLPSPGLADVQINVAPIVILLFCVLAALGTLMTLPAALRPNGSILGKVLLIASGLILALAVAHASAGQDLSGTGPYFWILSAVAIASAIRVITHPRPVYAALYFVLTVFASAGLFVLMFAEFMAAALVLIYAGAILVTYVFVIMLAATAQSSDAGALAGLPESDTVSREPLSACCIGFALMGVLLFLVFDKAGNISPSPLASSPAISLSGDDEAVHGSTQAIGAYLFRDQLVNLEVAGLILTVAMVGAIVISRRRVVGDDETFEVRSEEITATMTPLSDNPNSIPVYGTTNPAQKAFPET